MHHHYRRLAGIAVVLALAGALPAPAVSAAAPKAANGATCTIVGTAAADTLNGTRANDVICGLGGNDKIAAGAGRDVVDGGDGADRIDGGDGIDLVMGGAGNDQVAGGAAADRVLGSGGTDTLTVTAVDVCAAPAGDTLVGTCTADTAGPSIPSVSVPTVVAAGTTLTVSWRVTDATGVGLLDTGGPATWIQIGGAPGWLTWCGFQVPGSLVSGDAIDGTYQATCAIPANVPNGDYGIWVGAYDLAGTSTAAEQRATFSIAGGSSDTEAPAVSAVRIVGSVPGPGGTLVLEWRATDATGIDYTLPWVYGPNGLLVTAPGGTQWFGMGESPVRLSGDARDGVYRQSLPADPGLLPGTYQVWLSGRDTLGNRFYDAGPSGSGYVTFVVAG